MSIDENLYIWLCNQVLSSFFPVLYLQRWGFENTRFQFVNLRMQSSTAKCVSARLSPLSYPKLTLNETRSGRLSFRIESLLVLLHEQCLTFTCIHILTHVCLVIDNGTAN